MLKGPWLTRPFTLFATNGKAAAKAKRRRQEAPPDHRSTRRAPLLISALHWQANLARFALQAKAAVMLQHRLGNARVVIGSSDGRCPAMPGQPSSTPAQPQHT